MKLENSKNISTSKHHKAFEEFAEQAKEDLGDLNFEVKNLRGMIK